MRSTDRKMRWLSLALVALLSISVAALFAAGCGDDGETSRTTAGGNSTDAAFAVEMIAHHEGAVEMAESAEKRTEHAEIKELAVAIIAAQQTEIDLMSQIADDLEAEGVKPGSLGMSHAEMGMDFDMPMLDDAADFDKAFIDMMIPHHRGAIAMAKRQLDAGENAELLELAEEVITAQTAEIEQMQSWRKRWYGAELPGADDDGMMDHDGMDHGASAHDGM